jgi:hypothetical protein
MCPGCCFIQESCHGRCHEPVCALGLRPMQVRNKTVSTNCSRHIQYTPPASPINVSIQCYRFCRDHWQSPTNPESNHAWAHSAGTLGTYARLSPLVVRVPGRRQRIPRRSERMGLTKTTYFTYSLPADERYIHNRVAISFPGLFRRPQYLLARVTASRTT